MRHFIHRSKVGQREAILALFRLAFGIESTLEIEGSPGAGNSTCGPFFSAI